MDAETWLSAKEAVELGLADVIDAPNKMVASISEDYKNKFKNIPKALLEVDKEPQANVLTDEERQAILAETKESTNMLKKLKTPTKSFGDFRNIIYNIMCKGVN